MANVKVPPSNQEAEESVLGAILIDKDAINVASEILQPADFYNATYQIIFEAMMTLYESRSPIDVVTLPSELKKKKNGKGIGSSVLTDLVNAVPTAANVEHYARLIKDASTKRSLIQIGSEVTTLCFEGIKKYETF